MNAKQIEFIKMFEIEEVPVNRPIEVKNTDMKTELFVSEESDWLEITKGSSSFKIENVERDDVSYLYFVTSRLGCRFRFGEIIDFPVSYNGRLTVRITKQDSTCDLEFVDSYVNRTYNLGGMSADDLMELAFVMRAYNVYIHQ